MWFWRRKRAKAKAQVNGETNDADLRAVVYSDVGLVRTNNEDAVRFVRPTDLNQRRQKGYLAVLADGMGGHAMGEVAANLAIDTVVKRYYELPASPEKSLLAAVTTANQTVWQAAAQHPQQQGMGTTCTAVAIVGEQLYVAHIGDSRLYHLHNDALNRLTTDHTHVQLLVDQGLITPEQALHHPERNVLTQALGTRPTVTIDSGPAQIPFQNNDRLLLCSDGLYDYLSDNELIDYLRRSPVSDTAHQLIELAKLRGGHDNLTALLIERIAPDALQSPRPTANFPTP